MSYWRSEAKTDTGHSRLAAFNAKREGERVRFGALIINENTPTGEYDLTSDKGQRLTVVIPEDKATGAGYRYTTNELWETTDATDPQY